jgi:hypothetical protein
VATRRDKGVSLRCSALVLYRAALPELRLYEKARRVALKERRSVAQVRHEHPDVLPAFSLYGSALENVFKGIIVSKDPALISADNLSEKLKSHDLVRLARDARIRLSDHEQHVLKWVSEVLIWKARYSVPRKMKDTQHFFHSLDDVTLESAKTCIRTLDNVFARAKKALPRRRRLFRFGVLVDVSAG